ncbi:cytochrome P450 [Sinobacterium caligoides]|uniref:Cytochrome P450 n=1 Tax=Sinobacterium caligoides TaxID=933926 RepID=A0A3N2E063_9GAMM|nr:cytochrome P450 [Sinobacterium caligoides]ROS05474.1 cytochrome P450 [Sinobacterium caligoides]
MSTDDAVLEQLPKLEEVFDPSSDEYCNNPIKQCMALMERGPFVFYEPWQAWVMTDIGDIMECWRKEYLSSDFYDWEFAPPRPHEDDWGNFEKALIGHSLVSDHDHHRLIRKVVSPAFSRNVVDEIQRRIEPDIDKLFDAMGSPKSFDYITEVAEHIPFITITRLIGVPEKYWDEIKPLLENFTETWNPTISEERREEVRQQCNRGIDMIKVVIEERRQSPQQDDFLSTMLDIEAKNEKFTEWDIITLVLALIGAGADTTLMAQQWSVYALTKHPDQRQPALESAETFSNAFSEIMRWSLNSKMGFARYAPEDMDVLGQRVRKGQLVLLMPHLCRMDPVKYPNPEVLDVKRNFDPDVQFGYGPRYCIGAAMAKRQLFLTITKLFERFPNIELAEEPERDSSNHNSIALKKLMLKTNV